MRQSLLGGSEGQYATIRAPTERYGLTARATINVGEKAQFYMEGNYFHTGTFAQLPPNVYGNTATAPPTSVNYFSLLPVYVCPTGRGDDRCQRCSRFLRCTTTVPRRCDHAECQRGFEPEQSVCGSGQYGLFIGAMTTGPDHQQDAFVARCRWNCGTFGGNDEWNYNVEGTASEVRFDRDDQLPGSAAHC